MWFFCYLWQCSVQSCFGPIDMWKSWYGWSHVVHPSKDNSTSKRYLDRTNRAAEKVATNAAKPAVLLQRELFRNKDHSITVRWSGPPLGERLRCGVNLEVVPGPSNSHDCPEGVGGCSSAGAITRYTSAPKPGGHLQLLTEQAPGPEERDEEPTSPHRTPSPDRTTLEKNMEKNLDYWNREHARTAPRVGDEDKLPLVSYNDTGSLEEVKVDRSVDHHLEGLNDFVDISQMESDRDSLKLQYRRLWELRKTYEDDEDLAGPAWLNKKSKLQTKESEMTAHAPLQNQKSSQRDDSKLVRSNAKYQQQVQQIKQKKHEQQDETEIQQLNRSSPDQSPDGYAAMSHTTSFESNTEPYQEETGSSWHLLELPSYESRQQTHKDILGWRLGGIGARGTRQSSQEDTSFDSVDTDGSTTGACKLDQVTSSVESTTNNTESTCSAESQSHCLQHLRADSGYRSIENPPPRVTHRKLPLIVDTGDRYWPRRLLSREESDQEAVTVTPYTRHNPVYGGNRSDVVQTTIVGKHGHYPLGESDDLEDTSPYRHGDMWETTDTIVTAEGVALQSPTGLEPSSWEGRQRSCERSASMKRREFGRTATELENSALNRRYHSLSSRSYSTYTRRDYSVDERSDALFREFSRCEPWETTSKQRLAVSGGQSGYRRLPHPTHSHQSPVYQADHQSVSTRRGSHEEASMIRYSRDNNVPLTTWPTVRAAIDRNAPVML